ncbi:RNA polymerase sigma factor [Marinicella sediminis]|nr:sigma-70 family RNA polymerase sigma factor [Marinicella sediminis]
MTQTKAADTRQNRVADLEERNWLAAHLGGDQQAFAQLMQAYRKPLYSFLVRHGLDTRHCDDLFQDIFLKIHKSAHQYQASKPLSPWIFTIAINTLRDFQRKKSLHLTVVEVAETIEDERPDPEQSAHLTETMDWLEEALASLPKAQAEAMTLSMVKGMKIKDIGAMLGLPVNTIKSQLRRAKQSLMSAFQARQTQHRTQSSPSGVTHE